MSGLGQIRQSWRSWGGFVSIARLETEDGLPILVSRTGYTDELGYEIFCHPKDAESVWDTIWNAGQKYDIAPLGLEALDMLRIEARLIFATQWHSTDYVLTRDWLATITAINNSTSQEWLGKIPETLEVLADEFTMPTGATRILESQYCKNHTFVIDDILATAAHIEVTESMLQHWLKKYSHDIYPNGGSVQTINEIKDSIEKSFKNASVNR